MHKQFADDKIIVRTAASWGRSFVLRSSAVGLFCRSGKVGAGGLREKHLRKERWKG